MFHAAGRGTPGGPRRQSSLLGAAGGGTILRHSMTGSPRRALLLGTPQSEPGTPSAHDPLAFRHANMLIRADSRVVFNDTLEGLLDL